MSNILTYDEIENLEIELTLKCQLKCHYCDKLFKLRSTREINLSNIKSLILKFKNLKSIQLCGFGEPMLYSSLFELINFIHSLQNNIKIELFTNGTAVSKKQYKKLAKLLTSNDIIVCSIYGSTNALHSYYRIGQTLDELLDNIQLFKHSRCQIIIKYIQMEYNKCDFNTCLLQPNILINKFNIPNLLIKYEDDCWTTYEQFNYVQAKTLKICSASSLGYKLSMVFNKLNTNNFYAKKIFWCESYIKKSLFIDVNLNIFPCSDMRLASESLLIQKLLYDKRLKFNANAKNDQPHNFFKTFNDQPIFDYSDIYSLYQYKELCNQGNDTHLNQLLDK